MSVMKIKNNSVPAGVYVCEFDGTEESTHEKYGAGLVWKFVVVKGRHKGRTVTRVTKPDPTPRNSCGVFLAGLAGASPADDLEVDPDEYEGEAYLCTVAEVANGATRVENFIKQVADEDDAPAETEGSPRPGLDEVNGDLSEDVADNGF